MVEVNEHSVRIQTPILKKKESKQGHTAIYDKIRISFDATPRRLNDNR